MRFVKRLSKVQMLTNFRWMARTLFKGQGSKVVKLDERPEIIVSLTSYPPRYVTLLLTLKCLLSQRTQSPYAVVLWIAEADVAALPEQIVAMTEQGLSIRQCEDLRSYKKIVPLTSELKMTGLSPVAVVIADDDMYYPSGWLQALIDEGRSWENDVIAHRVHRIKYSKLGLPISYIDWEHCIDIQSGHPDNFATGAGGVYYPWTLLAHFNFDTGLIKEICPEGDDIWLFSETRRMGGVVRLATRRITCVEWEGSQEQALWKQNIGGGRNDLQVTCLWEKFGGWTNEQLK